MSGIFNFFQRMIDGQPVFETEQAEGDQAPGNDSPLDADANKATIRKGDDSSFPVVFVKRVTSHLHDRHTQVYGQIVNKWHEEIMLDKIRIFDTTRELDTFLKGNEEREILLYDGPLLTKEYHEAQLDYKTQPEGDYFQAMHDVSFTYHPDTKTYQVNELRLQEPIRDIYG